MKETLLYSEMEIMEVLWSYRLKMLCKHVPGVCQIHVRRVPGSLGACKAF